MITTIIFDIGNVLADFNWKKHYESFGYDEAMVERLARATVKSPLWNETDRGVIPREELMRRFAENDPEIAEDIYRVLGDVRTMVTRSEYAIPWIRELKSRGYRVLYLSNFGEKAKKDCAEALDFLPYMDGGILSYREKVIKPMPEIYERLIERYGLTPEECVFLDDTQANLDAAERFGIHTIRFQGLAQAVEELCGLGVDTHFRHNAQKK